MLVETEDRGKVANEGLRARLTRRLYLTVFRSVQSFSQLFPTALMGKRKSSKKPQGPKRRAVLGKSTSLLLCSNETD